MKQAPRGIKYGTGKGWALSNMGCVRGFYRTKTQAVRQAEEDAGEQWAKCKAYFEVWRCELRPI